jgi:hypothetical protein
MHPDFVKPRYDSGGFAGLPRRILEAAGQYDAVVFFFIDGFGWRFFERFQDTPFLKDLAKRGTVEQLTSQFPSTTAAHVTCIHTGLTPGESGIYEWNMYEPSLDTIITPLLFSYAGTTERDQLKHAKVDPKSIYPTRTLYHALAERGIPSFIHQHREYTPSTYSNVVFDGAQALGYKTFAEALTNLGEQIKRQTTPSYYFLYFEKIDSVSHDYGPASPQTEAEAMAFLLQMEYFFPRTLGATGRKTLFMLSADHGQAEIDPQTTIYLNTDPRFAGIEEYFKTNAKGKLIVPAGSCRDMFLHIKDDRLDEAQAFLAPRLAGKAEVVKSVDLIDAGYFGETISDIFRARVGNLVILSHRYESVWWYEKGRFIQKYYGQHGGLTPQEMLIPLLQVEL